MVRRIRSLVAAAVIGAGLVLLAVAVVVPHLAGATTYTVLSGSMTPSLQPGTLVVVRPDEHIGIGTVLTYQLRSGDPVVVTHRVVGVGIDGRGRRTYVTQGDANARPDATAVREEQVRGSVWYAVPWVGHIDQLLDPGQRRALAELLAVALLLYAVAMFAPRRRRAARHAAA